MFPLGMTSGELAMGSSNAGDESSGHLGRPDGVGRRRRLVVWQVVAALLLLAMGGIHLYLALSGVGGVLGVLFVLNAVGGVVLAIAMIAAPPRLLLLASVLSLLLMAGTLLALVLALTVGLFGITETFSAKLVPTTLVVESIGLVVLAVMIDMAAQARRPR
jgi:hypothetical protein